MSLLARRDSERTEDDPFSGALTTNHVNYDCMLGDTSHPNDDLQKILQSPGMQVGIMTIMNNAINTIVISV